MLLWDQSPRRILNVLMSSTARKFYTSEIIDQSSLSAPTVYQTLDRLVEAEIVVLEPERYLSESEWRAKRNYYSINPDVIDYLRIG